MRLAGHKLPHFLILTALAYGHAVLASAQQQTATQFTDAGAGGVAGVSRRDGFGHDGLSDH